MVTKQINCIPLHLRRASCKARCLPHQNIPGLEISSPSLSADGFPMLAKTDKLTDLRRRKTSNFENPEPPSAFHPFHHLPVYSSVRAHHHASVPFCFALPSAYPTGTELVFSVYGIKVWGPGVVADKIFARLPYGSFPGSLRPVGVVRLVFVLVLACLCPTLFVKKRLKHWPLSSNDGCSPRQLCLLFCLSPLCSILTRLHCFHLLQDQVTSLPRIGRKVSESVLEG